MTIKNNNIVKIWHDGDLLIAELISEPRNGLGIFKVRKILLSNNATEVHTDGHERYMALASIVRNFKIGYDEFQINYPEYLI